MEAERFEKFTLLIDGIHKSIGRLKNTRVPELGIKSVHVFWLYKLSEHPDGLCAAEIAAASMIDRSLVSREISALRRDGYVTAAKGRRYVLTDKGRALAENIRDIALDVQKNANSGITEEELMSFYKTLEKLHANFLDMSKEK